MALVLCAAHLVSPCETAFSDLSKLGRTDLVERRCISDSLLFKTVEELGGTSRHLCRHNGCDLNRPQCRDAVAPRL